MMSRRMKRRCMRAAVWLAFALSIAASAQATTIERMSLARMSQASPVIVHARCAGNSVVQDAGEIWTLTSFDVEETWRGEVARQITIRLLGGRMGNITSQVSGVPQFQPGEDVVLFLEPTKRGDFSVVGWQQGTFRIRRDASGAHALVTEDSTSFATFDPATRRFRTGGIRNMPLETFRARVAAALQGAAVAQP